MFDPPIGSGANLFIIITVLLIAAGAAIAAVDVYKDIIQSKQEKEKE
jgi:hypothetical protein